MSSWLVNVECKKKFRDSRNFQVSVQHPVLSDFDYKGERVGVKDIAEFMSKFGVDYSVLTVDLDLELLILVKTAEGVSIKNKPFLYAVSKIFITLHRELMTLTQNYNFNYYPTKSVFFDLPRGIYR